MEKFIKENLVYILLVIITLVGGGVLVSKNVTTAIEHYNEAISKKEDLENKQQAYEAAKKRKEQSQTAKQKTAQSGKVIYEVPGQQFSPEASFGIMIESILAHITNSGLRIRSIDYDNRSPVDDKILMTNISGYNVCEVSFVSIGTYAQLQSFFKNIVKENYLSNIYEVYIEPFDKNKTILIAKFKIRLYTKTI